MCGIVGFTGEHQAAPILLDGLSKLEYRGYDSAGLAVRDGENLAQVVKAKGRLSNLGGENGRWSYLKRYLRDRSYSLGNAWGTESDKCTSACVGKLQRFWLRYGRIRGCWCA